jgi:hypothetical protein
MATAFSVTESEPDMNRLLKLAVDAHGGLDRWNRLRTVEVVLSFGGAVWTMKRKPDLLTQVVFEADLHEQRATLYPFTAPDRRVRFTPDRVVLETTRGEIVEARDNPRASFDGHTVETPWDPLHAAYFTSYALWTYLTIPFLYTYPGFVTKEIKPWTERGEAWRQLEVTFPGDVATHTREQISCFGPDGLLRRHNYRVDVMDDAPRASYAFEYRTFGGIVVPTTRRIYAYDGDDEKISDPLWVSIDITSVTFR